MHRRLSGLGLKSGESRSRSSSIKTAQNPYRASDLSNTDKVEDDAPSHGEENSYADATQTLPNDNDMDQVDYDPMDGSVMVLDRPSSSMELHGRFDMTPTLQREGPFVTPLSPITFDHEAQRIIQRGTAAKGHASVPEKGPNYRDEILYKFFTSSASSSASESNRSQVSRRSTSSSIQRRVQIPPEQALVRETIHELYGSTFTHSRLLHSLRENAHSNTANSSTINRPKSAPVGDSSIDRSTLHIPSRPIDTSSGKSLLKESTTVESRILEANAQQKLREANECCKTIGSAVTWELAPRELSTTPLRVYQIVNGQVAKELSMELFLREHRRLFRERDRVVRESRYKAMEDQYRMASEKDPEETSKEAKATVRVGKSYAV
eukprot:TRINITY_DN5800_c0_g1_i7.p1 TRINITY_DN5800_c0_g1~~TRINITY_DN5800_c0_g1_i7.p1  ORF type:complete len:379 (+),score=64.53 TRINITY_DN5800_c0_g1_i7:101-1237(+)